VMEICPRVPSSLTIPERSTARPSTAEVVPVAASSRMAVARFFSKRTFWKVARHQALRLRAFQSDKRSVVCCLLVLANRLGVRYDRIIRADKRDVMRY